MAEKPYVRKNQMGELFGFKFNEECSNSKMKNSSYFLPMILIVVFFGMTGYLVLYMYLHSHQHVHHRYNHAAVATDTPACSRIASMVLKELKGNAVDAGIAAMICLGVLSPYASGIGGGGFALVKMKDMDAAVFDFRETSGINAREDMYDGVYEKSKEGLTSVAVPGELKGMEKMHIRYGSVPWKKLFQPSIDLARNGFEVDKLLEIRIRQNQNAILRQPGLKSVFMRNGEFLKENDILIRPELADTLELISNEGVSVFYSGELSKKILQELHEGESHLIAEDFSSYTVKEYRPNAIQYRDKFTILLPPAPASGSVIGFALNLLNKLPPPDSYDAQYIHNVIEVLKFAFTHRTLLGDPAFTNSREVERKFLYDSDYVHSISKKIHEKKTHLDWNYYSPEDGFDIPRDHGTTSLNVIDEEGNSVSITSTINHSFGSNIHSAFGFIYNNQMNDFSVDKLRGNDFGFKPSVQNKIEARKRSLSSMAPIIVLDQNGQVVVSTGASGGPTIISTVVQILTQILDLDLSPDVVVKRPRFHVLPGERTVKMEVGLDGHLIDKVKGYGHQFKLQKILADGHSVGNVGGIIIRGEDGFLYAGSDHRKMGEPHGY